MAAKPMYLDSRINSSYEDTHIHLTFCDAVTSLVLFTKTILNPCLSSHDAFFQIQARHS
jgi:hypothetical protein